MSRSSYVCLYVCMEGCMVCSGSVHVSLECASMGLRDIQYCSCVIVGRQSIEFMTLYSLVCLMSVSRNLARGLNSVDRVQSQSCELGHILVSLRYNCVRGCEIFLTQCREFRWQFREFRRSRIEFEMHFCALQKHSRGRKCARFVWLCNFVVMFSQFG